MRLFHHAFITLFLFAGVVYADEYSLKREFSLQKDEQKKFLVKYDTERKLFRFRWTLYINDVLTVLRSYDLNVAQHILQLNHANQSFRVQLMTRGLNERSAPYILVKFKEFDFQKNEAKFVLLLYNNGVTINLEEIKEK